jgi:hypothetical protein
MAPVARKKPFSARREIAASQAIKSMALVI